MTIRNSKYRLIWYKDEEILLNLEEEMTNLDNIAPSHPEIVKTMNPAEYERSRGCLSIEKSRPSLSSRTTKYLEAPRGGTGVVFKRRHFTN